MPLKLSTTIGKIQNIPNSKNIEIINEFLEYMRNHGSEEHHQNNNLKIVIAFGNCIGKYISFYDINKKDQVLEFLNTKVKTYDEDQDKRLIITSNNFICLAIIIVVLIQIIANSNILSYSSFLF